MTARTFAAPLPADPRNLLGWDEKSQTWVQNRAQTMSLIRTFNQEIGNGEKLDAVTKERDALKAELARVKKDLDDTRWEMSRALNRLSAATATTACPSHFVVSETVPGKGNGAA
jgi:seryl-tRNA synthetase